MKNRRGRRWCASSPTLSEGNYAEAAALFGGEIDDYLRQPLPDETPEAYWEYLCTYLWCLPVAEITSAEQVSADKYLFYVVFVYPGWQAASRSAPAAAATRPPTRPSGSSPTRCSASMGCGR